MNDPKKKKILIIISIPIILAVLSLSIIYLVNINKDSEEKPKEEEKEVIKEEEKKYYYVSCDDNTAQLNVRKSLAGDIIDGLSCYKKVTILEEESPTETCDSGWYKITYQKYDENYTGYVCGNYIKQSLVSTETYDQERSIIDKANAYHEKTILKPYCGQTSDSKIIEYKTEGGTFQGEYLKSEYKTLEELKSSITSFLDESLIKTSLTLGDYNNPQMYDDYYLIEGNLYCRNYTGKGYLTYYTGNYEIEIESVKEDKININISYEYLDEDSKCNLKELSKCPKSNFQYELGKVTITNNKITKIDFHK